MISFWQILICFPVPILLAVCVTEMKNKLVSRLTQTATLLPHFVSVVVVCGMVVNFLSPSTGIVNMILSKLGIEPIYFMVQPQYFRGIYTGMTLWQNAGFNALVFIAAIMGIDPQPVSYTHLDVYKRQAQCSAVDAPCLASCPCRTIAVALVSNAVSRFSGIYIKEVGVISRMIRSYQALHSSLDMSFSLVCIGVVSGYFSCPVKQRQV